MLENKRILSDWNANRQILLLVPLKVLLLLAIQYVLWYVTASFVMHL